MPDNITYKSMKNFIILGVLIIFHCPSGMAASAGVLWTVFLGFNPLMTLRPIPCGSFNRLKDRPIPSKRLMDGAPHHHLPASSPDPCLRLQ